MGSFFCTTPCKDAAMPYLLLAMVKIFGAALDK